MADRARFAYGSKNNVAAAIESGAVDAFDFLCLSGENERPSVGWIDKNGNPIYVEYVKYIEVVSSLPEVGEEGIIYMLEGKGYAWHNNEFVPMSQSEDISALEAEIAKKVDATAVEEMVEAAIAESSGTEVIEF